MKRQLLKSLLVLAALALPSIALSQSDFRVLKIIGDLNGDSDSNKRARKELRDLGSQASPQLVREINKYTSLAPSDLLSAARCFRALAEIGDPGAVDVAARCIRSLDIGPEPSGDYRRVLLAEAVRYLASQCSQHDASDALIKFLQGSSEEYENPTKKIYQATAWEPDKSRGSSVDSFLLGRTGRRPETIVGWSTKMNDDSLYRASYDYQDAASTYHDFVFRVRRAGGGCTLLVDVYDALSKMAESKSCQVESVLCEFLKRHPYKITLYFERLGNDGFTPGVYTFPADSGSSCEWLDNQARPRMVAMRLLSNAGSQDSVPCIQPLLRSPHNDERQQALASLEQLSAAGASQDAAADHSSADIIRMRNGDVISGSVKNGTITMRTTYAELKFDIPNIKSIEFQNPASKADTVRLRSGDTLSGKILNETIDIDLRAGGTTSVRSADMSTIEIHR